MPEATTGNTGLRWRGKPERLGNKCPMGKMREASSWSPTVAADFDPILFTTQQVRAFGLWWDSLNDPEKAVAAVWGKKR